MKKILMIAATVLIIAGMSSCKKDYECCYVDANGTKLDATSGFGCATGNMSKSDAEDLDARMTTVAAAEFNGTAACEKK